jgi:SecD/SecF fusion protein
MHLVLSVDTSKVPEKAREGATERALEIIRNRIDQFGISEPVIQRQGENMIVVQLPGVTDRQRALDLIGRTALLEFKLVSDDADLLRAAVDEGNIPAGYDLKEAEEDSLLVEKEASLTGKHLTDAVVKFDQSRFNEPYVAISLDREGAKIFSEITGDNVGKRLAIVLDGEVRSAPVIRERIPQGQAQITGNFSVDSANDLAIVLRAGALPAPIMIEEERTIGPLLGRDSIISGIKACLIGLVLVFTFMLIYYLFAGVVATVALVLNMIIILGFLGMLGGTLTLPGIAGFILTLGMAVDANVLIYERIREELKVGKTLRSAIDSGYHKALTAILDSNITTVVAAALLFRFGTGPIRGFAMTLTFGIAASLFTAIIVTRLLFDMSVKYKIVSKLPMLRLFQEPKYEFIKFGKFCFIFSLVVIIGGMMLFGKRGQDNFGVDFAGGTIQEYDFNKPVDTESVRVALEGIGLSEAKVQQFRDDKSKFMIKTQEDKSINIEAEFKKTLEDNSFNVLRIETVGPTVGEELKKKAALSLVLGLGAILLYVWIRFNILYGIAGVLALFHDVLIAIGALALTHRQFDLTIVAALLTIAGYSVNDTVVTYDRIRENMKFSRKGSFKDLVNFSLNQVLTRTILTTFTTLLVVWALLYFGGHVINGFAFTLMVGFISGIYSTIFIAIPFLIIAQKKFKIALRK